MPPLRVLSPLLSVFLPPLRAPNQLCRVWGVPGTSSLYSVPVAQAHAQLIRFPSLTGHSTRTSLSPAPPRPHSSTAWPGSYLVFPFREAPTCPVLFSQGPMVRRGLIPAPCYVIPGPKGEARVGECQGGEPGRVVDELLPVLRVSSCPALPSGLCCPF